MALFKVVAILALSISFAVGAEKDDKCIKKLKHIYMERIFGATGLASKCFNKELENHKDMKITMRCMHDDDQIREEICAKVRCSPNCFKELQKIDENEVRAKKQATLEHFCHKDQTKIKNCSQNLDDYKRYE